MVVCLSLCVQICGISVTKAQCAWTSIRMFTDVSAGMLRNGRDSTSRLLVKVLNIPLEEDVWLLKSDAFDRDNGERETLPWPPGEQTVCFCYHVTITLCFLALSDGSHITLALLPATKEKRRKQAPISSHFSIVSGSTGLWSPDAYTCV